VRASLSLGGLHAEVMVNENIEVDSIVEAPLNGWANASNKFIQARREGRATKISFRVLISELRFASYNFPFKNKVVALQQHH
jgi:hypothetical protein